MNKNELVEELAHKTKLSKAKAAQVLEAFIAITSKAISNGNDVRLVGFGTFTVIHRKATEGRNPRNGAVIKIAAKNKPKFKPGLALTEAVNKVGKKK